MFLLVAHAKIFVNQCDQRIKVPTNGGTLLQKLFFSQNVYTRTRSIGCLINFCFGGNKHCFTFKGQFASVSNKLRSMLARIGNSLEKTFPQQWFFRFRGLNVEREVLIALYPDLLYSGTWAKLTLFTRGLSRQESVAMSVVFAMVFSIRISQFCKRKNLK